MSLSTANAARAKPRYSDPNLVNEEIWVGHADDHDNLHAPTAGIFGVDFVIGSEADDMINIAMQFTDADGSDVAEVVVATVYLSDVATGIGIAATAPDTAVTAGTDGAVLAVVVTDKVLLMQSEADGALDLLLDETSIDTWFVCVVLPNGTLAISAAVTFA